MRTGYLIAASFAAVGLSAAPTLLQASPAAAPLVSTPPTAPPTTAAPAATTSTTTSTTSTTTSTTTTTMPPLPAAPVVVLYGDSLGWEAAEQFEAQFSMYPQVRVITRTFGGTAICDWLSQMQQDAVELQPWAVLIQFSGNALTPCMLTGEAHDARYRADAQAAIGIFAAVDHVFVVGAPVDRGTNPDYRGGSVNQIYRELSVGQVRFVDAGAALLDDGAWTNTLPCLPLEPCTGGVDPTGQPVNVVRAPDGSHFCPSAGTAQRGVTGPCGEWSSGAYRFASAMAAPVLELLGPGLLG